MSMDNQIAADILEAAAFVVNVLTPDTLNALLKGAGWQPIATAPKDGTEILVCNDNGHYYPVVAEYLGGGWSHHGGWVEDDGKYFTHWHPLPKPPWAENEAFKRELLTGKEPCR